MRRHPLFEGLCGLRKRKAEEGSLEQEEDEGRKQSRNIEEKEQKEKRKREEEESKGTLQKIGGETRGDIDKTIDVDWWKRKSSN